MTKIIAGIGSRETPPEIKTEMVKIGQWCKEHKVWVRSGHAPGADQAFEKGAQELCIAYLPWADFEKKFTSSAHFKVPDQWDRVLAHAKEFHPAWDKLSTGAKKLMARNSAQVLGLTLLSPVDMVVCWTKDGKATGGTGQALRIAEKAGIPIINMYFEGYSTAEKVIEVLEKLL